MKNKIKEIKMFKNGQWVKWDGKDNVDVLVVDELVRQKDLCLRKFLKKEFKDLIKF